MGIFIKIELECVWPTVPIKNLAQVSFFHGSHQKNSTRIINVTHNKTGNVSDATLYTFRHRVESIRAGACIQACPKLSNPLFVLYNFNHFELSTHIYNQTLCIKAQQRIFSRKVQPELIYFISMILRARKNLFISVVFF